MKMTTNCLWPVCYSNFTEIHFTRK